MGKDFLFTSESVTSGHPDKLADQISDAVLDEYLKRDKNARVACESMLTTGKVFVAGEISSDATVDIESVVRKTLRDVGYVNDEYGINADTCDVIISIDEQSKDIAEGVDDALETRGNKEDNLIGAGDQGIMFGYATNETDGYLPSPIYYAHGLAKRLEEYRRELEGKNLDVLRPDGKTQVTVEYKNGKPERIDTIVISTQHSEEIEQHELEYLIKRDVIKKVLPENLLDDETKYFINPSGRFVIGGPQGDVGLTGRKIIVDTYGGWSRHGGGAYSSKDATKVDRSASYMARYVAKNIVAAGLAEECEVQLAYAIGKAEPVSIYVTTFGTGKILTDKELVELIEGEFKLDPKGIIETLELDKPVFKETSVYGHFGRDEFSWEKTILAETLFKKAQQLKDKK